MLSRQRMHDRAGCNEIEQVSIHGWIIGKRIKYRGMNETMRRKEGRRGVIIRVTKG